jgi:uncharacterized repeat protein (TIGR04076 family)
MKYELYDLIITTSGEPHAFNCSHKAGEGLIVEGENIRFLPGTRYFSHYALATLMPYIAAKQRANQLSDWMYFESEIACPDPRCGARFVIKRLDKREYNYTVREQNLRYTKNNNE